jgi:hypothetical protein
MSLPYSLAIAAPGGWSNETIATFAEAADLWLFWESWSDKVRLETRASALLWHSSRYGIAYHRPTDKAAFLVWAAEREANAKRGKA